MTDLEARKIVADFDNKNVHTDDEVFMYTEAMDHLITSTNDPGMMMQLGGYYYGQRKYDLALKYYEMASSFDYEPAHECLGYIWYYGRTGEKDYEKAFKHFSAAAKRGNIVARYKLADMYKNGYYVEQDKEKYKAIVEELYPLVKRARNVYEPLPEIFTRLARIRSEEGNIDEAVKLYRKAKDFLAQRIMYSPFFGNLNIMKWLVEDLYRLSEPDSRDIDLFDLYYYLLEPIEISFYCFGKKYTVRSSEQDDEVVIEFNGQWFRNTDDFFSKAKIGDKLLTEKYFQITDMRIVK